MQHTKKKFIKSNLKTSLYFAGGITFGTVATGAAVSIPVYISIQKSLQEAIKAFAALNGYMSSLAAKLGLPVDENFEQELAHGYEAVYTPGKGTQIFKEINGEKVLMMETNGDGTVKTAAQFAGVEALTMMDAINNAKDAYGDETEAMDSIMKQYGAVAEDQSYLTESATIGKPIYILILRDSLAHYFDKNNPNDASKDAMAVADAQKNYDAIANRNALQLVTINSAMIAEARGLLVEAQVITKLDKQAATGTLDSSQQQSLEAARQKTNTSITDAQSKIEVIKAAQTKAVQAAAANVAATTQAKVMQNISSNTNAQEKFLDSNTTAIQKWLPIFGATFGYEKSGTLPAQEPSNILRKSIYDKLIEKGMDKASLEKLKDELMDIIGLSSEKSTWEQSQVKASKKILSVTQVLSTFASEGSEDERVVVLNITVKNIVSGKNETYILLGHPSGTILPFDFDKFHIEGNGYGVLKTQDDFDQFMSTVNQLALIAQPSIDEANKKYTSEIKASALGQITTIINEIDKDGAADIKNIKLTNNSDASSQLDAFISSNLFKNNTSRYNALANKLFSSNFTDLQAKSINFNVKTSLINLLNNFALDDNSNDLYNYFYENLSTFDANLNNVASTYLNNSKFFKTYNLFAKLKSSKKDLLFNASPLFSSNLKLVPDDQVTKDAITTFDDEFLALLQANKQDAIFSIYLDAYKFYKSLGLTNDLINKLRPTLLAFDNDDIINAVKKLEIQFKTSAPLEFTRPNWKQSDAILDYFKNHIDLLVKQIKTKVDINQYVQQLNWVYWLGFDNDIESKLIPLVLTPTNQTIFDNLISLSKDTSWKPETSEGVVAQPAEVIKNFISTHVQTFIDQINSAKDITTIKESMRYAFKGLDVSNVETQGRIDAAKDVAKEIESIQGLDDTQKKAIQKSVENVITSQQTKSLTPEQFAELMKYTQTVFKVFPTAQQAGDKLKKILDPNVLMEEDSSKPGFYPLIDNITTLNSWVDAIIAQSNSSQVTLESIKQYVWTKDLKISKLVDENGKDPYYLTKQYKSVTDYLVGSQMGNDGIMRSVSSQGGNLFEIPSQPQNSNTTIIKLISEDKQPDYPQGNSTVDNNGDIWTSELHPGTKHQYIFLYKYDAIQKQYDEHQYTGTFDIDQSSSGVTYSVDTLVHAGNFFYSISKAKIGDNFKYSSIDVTQIKTDATTHKLSYAPAVAFNSLSGVPDEWEMSGAQGTFTLNSQDYVYIPLLKNGEMKIVIYEANNGLLENPQTLNVSTDIIPQQELVGLTSSADITGTNINPVINNKFTMFVNTKSGAVYAFAIDGTNSAKIILDEKQSQIIVSQAYAKAHNFSDAVGIGYNSASKTLLIVTNTQIMFIPDASTQIRSIYDELLTI